MPELEGVGGRGTDRPFPSNGEGLFLPGPISSAAKQEQELTTAATSYCECGARQPCPLHRADASSVSTLEQAVTHQAPDFPCQRRRESADPPAIPALHRAQ
jgi:hypothetical protein